MSDLLDAGGREGLEALCETVAGRLCGRQGRPTVSELADMIDARIARAEITARRSARQLLRQFSWPAGMLRYGGGLLPFSRAGLPRRERVVRSLLGSGRRGAPAVARMLFRHLASAAVLGAPGECRTAAGGAGANPDHDVWLPLAGLKPGQTRLACEWLVIGSGPAGSIMAAELAETGASVLLVDRGPLVQRGTALDEATAAAALMESSNAWSTGIEPVLVTAARTFGGGSVINWGTCLDPPAGLLPDWSRRTGFNWDRNEGFRHSLFAVRQRLGVMESPIEDHLDQQLFRAGQAAGMEILPTGNNTAGCMECGNCQTGCPAGTKRDMRATWLPDATRLGVWLLPDCRVQRIEFSGRVASVAHAELGEPGAEPRRITIQFRRCVLAAGAIHTPAILQRSGYSNPHLGRNLALHPSILLPAVFGRDMSGDRGPIQAWLGIAGRDGETGAPSTIIERAPMGAGLQAGAIPFRSQREFADMVESREYWASLLVLVRDRGRGRIKLSPTGRPQVSYSLGMDERRRLARGAELAGQMLLAAGAKAVYGPRWEFGGIDSADDLADSTWLGISRRRAAPWKLWSAHPLGSCRMGAGPQEGVVDETGRVFGFDNLFVADGSVFPSAVGVNPMVTICAVAHWLAQRIKELARRESSGPGVG